MRTDFGRSEAQSAPYVRCLVHKLKETGIIIDKPKREKKIAAMAESVCKAPLTSISSFSVIEHFGNFENWADRVDCCMYSRGSHLNEIIFHY